MSDPTLPPGRRVERRHGAGFRQQPDDSVSVIIPTLNEASTLSRTLAGLRSGPRLETIVVDGGSLDGTPALAHRCGARVIHSPPGRGRQMNAGAAAARSALLLFLHADTRLPEQFDAHARRVLNRPGVIAGAFRLRIDSPRGTLRLIERAVNWRSRCLQLPYGDQALFLKAELFRELGGFADLPIMEDFDLVCRLRRRGRIGIAAASTLTSARRWEQLGPWRTTLLNQFLIAAFRTGVDPHRLAHWYRRNGA